MNFCMTRMLTAASLLFVLVRISSAHKPDYLPDDVKQTMPAKECINFIAFGDWGWNGHYCQTAVAEEMGPVAKAIEAGFIVSLGQFSGNRGPQRYRSPLAAELRKYLYASGAGGRMVSGPRQS